jgi:hypothetical protein
VWIYTGMNKKLSQGRACMRARVHVCARACAHMHGPNKSQDMHTH